MRPQKLTEATGLDQGYTKLWRQDFFPILPESRTLVLFLVLLGLRKIPHERQEVVTKLRLLGVGYNSLSVPLI